MGRPHAVGGPRVHDKGSERLVDRTAVRGVCCKGVFTVIVAASTGCFADLALPDAIGQLEDLEYTAVTIEISESGEQLKPSQVLNDVEQARQLCRDTHRLNICSYWVQLEPDEPEYYEKFAAICKLAKATKVVTLTMPSGELGIPFNEEVERLRKLVAIAKLDGARVSIRTQAGRLSEDPDTLTVLCDNVDGLGVTLDPSYFIYKVDRPRSYEKILKYVHHVLLRDTKEDQFQVRVGQGKVDFGRLVNQLRRHQYQRALCIDVQPLPDVDQRAELRKLRLLLESLL